MPFWATFGHIWINRTESGASCFSISFLFFLGLALGIDFGWFLIDFGSIFDWFLVHFWLFFGWFLVHFLSIFHIISRFKKQAMQHRKQKKQHGMSPDEPLVMCRKMEIHFISNRGGGLAVRQKGDLAVHRQQYFCTSSYVIRRLVAASDIGRAII